MHYGVGRGRYHATKFGGLLFQECNMDINKNQLKGQFSAAKGKVNTHLTTLVGDNKFEVKVNIQNNVGAVCASLGDVNENSRSRCAANLFALMAVAGASLMMSMPAFAELSPALDRVSLTAGVFRADPKFNAGLNTQYGNLQSGDIGLGMETMPRVKADLVIFDSQGLSFDYYQYKRGYAGSVANNTQVLGTTLTTVGSANLNLKLDFMKLESKWWFGGGDTVLGLGAGAAYYTIGLNANATASINNATASISSGYSNDALAPLLGIGVRHAISPDLRLFADASGVKQLQGRLSGEIYNAAIGGEWFPVKNVGVVLDYSMSQFDLVRHGSLDVNFKLKLQGPSASIKARF